MGYEQEIGPRLISAGGNIFALQWEVPKIGVATRGRGFWAGKSRSDPDNPDVDCPSTSGAQTLILPEEGKPDGMADDVDPFSAVAVSVRDVRRIALKDAKALEELVQTTGQVLQMGKAICLLTDPDMQTEDQLAKSVEVVAELSRGDLDPAERAVLGEYAERVRRVLLDAAEAREVLAKAILTKPSEARDKERQASTPAKDPPKKASKVAVNAKGKTQYDYPRTDPKKGSQGASGASAGPQGGAAPGGDASEAPAGPQDASAGVSVTPPDATIDPSVFAKLLGVSVKRLRALASQQPKHVFQEFFLGHQEFVRKHNLHPDYFGRLYDSLVGSSQPASVPPSAQATTPQAPAAQQAVKSWRWQARGLRGDTAELVKALIAGEAFDFCDIQRVMCERYGWSGAQAKSNSRMLLSALEARGIARRS